MQHSVACGFNTSRLRVSLYPATKSCVTTYFVDPLLCGGAPTLNFYIIISHFDLCAFDVLLLGHRWYQGFITISSQGWYMSGFYMHMVFGNYRYHKSSAFLEFCALELSGAISGRAANGMGKA